MKYNKENFSTLCRIMYEFTGNQFWLLNHKPCLIWFYEIKTKINEMVNEGEVCRYNLYNFETKKTTPFMYNSINL